MRKLISKENRAKKQERNNLIIGVVLISIMFLGTIGYSFYDKGEDSSIQTQINYGGHEFILNNGLWIVEKEGRQFGFKTNPNEISGLENSLLNSIGVYENKPLYISSSENDALSEVYINMNNVAQRIQLACLEGTECEEDLPIKNCSNNFIIISETEENSIKQEENCVFIEGNSSDLVKLVDEFLLKIIGIK
ncbi:hypothetical protein HN832_02570 [archaeon]|jgi:hypothetical protein|nr:hypothetical protein [archaeon]MBT4373238.1 hypothetical protein [archaeon]MBT4531583.1 hypothetical protein [archaeon]MBT7001239.1 hypothetical protein [archaeon]MBT7282275.1 hypothetical protein [archaeon]